MTPDISSTALNHLRSLEDLSDDTLLFAETGHTATLNAFGQNPLFEHIKKDVLTHLESTHNIPLCEEHRGKMYHFLQDKTHPKGVYRAASTHLYRAGLPDWSVLFSVADFDNILGDDVYLSGIAHLELQPNLVLLSFSPQGADASYIIEFDLETQSICSDGFHFPLGKSHVSWRDTNSVWVCPGWDARQLTQSAYPKEAWILHRGQSFDEATPILSANTDDVEIDAWRYLDAQGAPLDMLSIKKQFFQQEYYLVTASLHPQKLPLPMDCEVCGYLGGQLLIKLRHHWHYKKQNFQAGSLLSLPLKRGAIGEITVLFVPTDTQNIECVETSKHYVLIHYLDNVRASLASWSLKHNVWSPETTPTFNTLSLEIMDQPWEGDVFYLLTEDLLNPPTLYTWNAHLKELCVLRRRKAVFDASTLSIEQHHAISADGTRIPYFWCGQSASAHTPTLVYAYGGFDVSQLPHYLPYLGRYWLDKGYAFVLANIRGGGEFGPSWHQSAQGRNKHNSVDDLLSVLDDLYLTEKTSPEYTALQGGSNGGLIVALAMTTAPQKMGALVCEMPLIDMMRFDQLGAGHSWIEEFGNPALEEDLQHLERISPLHQLNESTDYPPILITTDLFDDRVHPAHAFKFHHQLKGKKSWLYVNDSGGHTGNSTHDRMAQEFALIHCFLEKHLNPASP